MTLAHSQLQTEVQAARQMPRPMMVQGRLLRTGHYHNYYCHNPGGLGFRRCQWPPRLVSPPRALSTGRHRAVGGVVGLGQSKARRVARHYEGPGTQRQPRALHAWGTRPARGARVRLRARPGRNCPSPSSCTVAAQQLSSGTGTDSGIHRDHHDGGPSLRLPLG